MKNKDKKTTVGHPLNYTLDAVKIGHSALTGLMLKSPAAASIAITNDAVLNITISATAQGMPLSKATVEFIGGLAAGTVCTISGGYFSGTLAASFCGLIGSELTGQLYDLIDNYRSKNNLQTDIGDESSLEDVILKSNLDTRLKEGDYAYINAGCSDGMVYTKVNGVLKPVVADLALEYSMFQDIQLVKSVLEVPDVCLVSSIFTPNILTPNYEVTYNQSGCVNKAVFSTVTRKEFEEANNILCHESSDCKVDGAVVRPYSNIFFINEDVKLPSSLSELGGVTSYNSTSLSGNKAINSHLDGLATKLESEGDTETAQTLRKAVKESSERMDKMQEAMQDAISKAFKVASEEMAEDFKKWKLDQERPENKLAKFGISKEDISIYPVQTRNIMKEYDQFDHFFNYVSQHLKTRVSINDLPENIEKFNLIIGHPGAIVELFERNFIGSIRDLPDDLIFLVHILENSMAIEFLHDHGIIFNFEDLRAKILDLNILESFEATSDKVVEILELEGRSKDAMLIKYLKELSTMSEEAQCDQNKALEVLAERGKDDIIEFLNHQHESEVSLLGADM